MVQVTNRHVYGIQIDYKEGTDTKAAKYVLQMNTLKCSLPVPQDASNMTETHSILLEQFYTKHNMQLPKNGFNVVRITLNKKLAIPNKD